jgi:NAD(P)-dependent dehydrogenase (short-subunit alcohol dehydrogenase family)
VAAARADEADESTGQGFGKGIVEKFLAEGAKVVIADFVEAVGSKAAQELKCKHTSLATYHVTAFQAMATMRLAPL